MSELFSSKLLCENTRCLAQAISLSLYLLQRERNRGGEQLFDTPQRLINESARGKQGERGLDLPLSLFQTKSFCTSLSSLLFVKLMKRPAFLSQPPLLTGHRHLFTVVGEPCSHGAGARRRLDALLNTVRDGRNITNRIKRSIGSARAKSLNIQARREHYISVPSTDVCSATISF